MIITLRYCIFLLGCLWSSCKQSSSNETTGMYIIIYITRTCTLFIMGWCDPHRFAYLTIFPLEVHYVT